MSENNSGLGCLGVILTIFMFFFLAPPLVVVAWDFWFQIACKYQGWQCDIKHIIEWKNL